MEEKENSNEEIEKKTNAFQHLSLQQSYFINQLNNENEELINLRLENERLQNDLNTKKKANLRMLKCQENMNQMNEKIQYRHKGKVGIGYT